MANSYTTVPNVLPGNVSVGGDLDVKGEILVGPGTERLHLVVSAVPTGAVQFNLQKDFATRDNPANPAHQLAVRDNTQGPYVTEINAAGSLMSDALPLVLATDYTTHNHTGTITEDTIYSKLIRGGLIGLDGGLRIRMMLVSSVQGGVGTTLRVKLGATTLNTYVYAALQNLVFEMHLGNQHNAAVQAFDYSWRDIVAHATVENVGAAAVNTAADQTLVVTVQNGAAGDTQAFQFFRVELLNSFGPV